MFERAPRRWALMRRALWDIAKKDEDKKQAPKPKRPGPALLHLIPDEEPPGPWNETELEACDA